MNKDQFAATVVSQFPGTISGMARDHQTGRLFVIRPDGTMNCTQLGWNSPLPRDAGLTNYQGPNPPHIDEQFPELRQPVSPPSEFDPIRLYALGACYLAAGRFERLTTEQLSLAMMVANVPLKPINEFLHEFSAVLPPATDPASEVGKADGESA